MWFIFFLSLFAYVHAKTVTYDFNVTEKWMAPDGFWRAVIAVNGQSPGPTIRARQGDTIVVNVFNGLTKDITLHFHGLQQRGTPSMDGVPYVTQYPIPYGQSFRYEFNTSEQYGTYWYHAHVSGVYADGLRGPMVIESKEHPFHYDKDETLMVYDWYHASSDALLTTLRSTGVFPNCIQSILFNGRGQYKEDNCSDVETAMMMGDFINGYDEMSFNTIATVTHVPDVAPYTVNANPGETVLLRFINAGALVDLDISIDQHSMKVVEADGLYLAHPQTVETLHLSVGQRYSVLVNVTQDAWIRATRLNTDEMMQQSIEGRAVLKYNASSSSSSSLPSSTRWENGTALDEKALSPMDSFNPPKSTRQLRFNLVNYKGNVWTINGKPYKDATVPSICKHQHTDTSYDIRYGDVVDLILQISPNATDTMAHPFHLHGHKFWVLGFGTDEYKASELNEINPPYRDSMYLPQSGWLALRFKADNPGTWLFHCHIEWHMDTGMAILFNEAFDKIHRPQFCNN
ncbi:hypothetical protein EC973_002531 [Apophysomyces ossiformis]|uniref:Multicopper oxidase n=1 Tax=Apophysomyces ossiformis TaxID=679940 RepID=A0A8H7ET44_9FUNG|nr:hypothetical protein EC973_002531 [Apophysomyces ossiformis]